MAEERELTPYEITRMIHDKKRCQVDIGFMDAIKMDVSQIEGTRYKFRLSEERPEL